MMGTIFCEYHDRNSQLILKNCCTNSDIWDILVVIIYLFILALLILTDHLCHLALHIYFTAWE